MFRTIEATGKRRVGLLGLSFKPGTDDLRESPMVALAERLLGRGFELMIYDPQVAVSRLLGANRAYVDQRIPHLSRLMASSAGEVVAHAEVVVVGAADPDGIAELAGRRPLIVDLVRFPGSEGTKATRGTSVSAGRPAGPRVLILVENLSVPFDRRVWQECRA